MEEEYFLNIFLTIFWSPKKAPFIFLRRIDIMKNKIDTRQLVSRICIDAAFAAITTVLYLFAKFNLAIFPSFLDINLSMIPVIICAFMIGPWDSALCVLVRFVIKIMTLGTSTGYVGEFADLLIGALTCIPAGIIYNYTDSKRKTLYAFLSVIICWVLAGIFTNMFINIPFYKSYWHINNAVLANMISKPVKLITFGAVKSVSAKNFMLYYIIFTVIPFNLMLSLVIVAVTIPVHKRLRVLYEMFAFKKNKDLDSVFDDEKKEIKIDSYNRNENHV